MGRPFLVGFAPYLTTWFPQNPLLFASLWPRCCDGGGHHLYVSTSTNILCERTGQPPVPMEESIRACGDAGFTCLDFGFAELAFFSPEFRGPSWREKIERCGKLARDRGITFVQGHGSLLDFCNRGEDYAFRLELLKRSFYGAQMLEIPWLVVHPSCKMTDRGPEAGTHEKNVAFFSALSDFAAPLGVGIAIENMWSGTNPRGRPYAVDAEELLRLARDVNRPNVGVCWDIEHASVEQLPQGDSIRLLGSYIKATHISDDTGPANIHILPYTGKLHWEEVLRAFADIGYDGPLSLEIQHYLLRMPPELWVDAIGLARKIGANLCDEIRRMRDGCADSAALLPAF